MAPKKYTLHAPAGSFRAFKTLIAAEYGGVDVTVAKFDGSVVKKLSPFGRAPVLETEQGAITSSNAICRYISAISPAAGLLGANALERVEVDGWLDFASRELELPGSVWIYPVVGHMDFRPEAYARAKEDLAASLAALDARLAGRTYLVGGRLTLADIAVACALVYPFKLVADPAYLKPHANVVKWFQNCVKAPEFVNVIGEVAMCQKELKAP